MNIKRLRLNANEILPGTACLIIYSFIIDNFNTVSPIVFYDGECGFCNRTVQFILDRERRPELYFCALQSDSAKDFFSKRNLPEPDFSTFYYFNGTQLFFKSGGALRVCSRLKFPWLLMPVFLVVPPFIRNGVYDFIAGRRKSLANQQCALPTPEQRKRFLG